MWTSAKNYYNNVVCTQYTNLQTSLKTFKIAVSNKDDTVE